MGKSKSIVNQTPHLRLVTSSDEELVKFRVVQIPLKNNGHITDEILKYHPSILEKADRQIPKKLKGNKTSASIVFNKGSNGMFYLFLKGQKYLGVPCNSKTLMEQICKYIIEQGNSRIIVDILLRVLKIIFNQNNP